MRINARLDKQSEENLQFIQQQTHATVTEIIKRLLAEHAEQLKKKQQPGSKLQAFLHSDFIASGQGPVDGSINYKNYISEAIDDKLNHR